MPPNSMSAKLLEWFDKYEERIKLLCNDTGNDDPRDMYCRSMVGDPPRMTLATTVTAAFDGWKRLKMVYPSEVS